MPSTSVLSRYYLKELRRVLHGPGPLLRFVFATMMHAVGHALMALIASALALSVAVHWGARSPALASADLGLPFAAGAASSALCLSAVGLLVVVVKGAAGVYATYVQVRVAGEVGCRLRIELLDALLCIHRVRQPRHEDQAPASAPTAHAVLALTDRVRDVEVGLGRGLLGSVRAIAQLVPIALMLVALSPRMALAAAALLIPFGWALGRLRARYRRASAEIRSEHERLHEAADDAVRHADLWISYGAAPKVRASVRRLGEALATGSARLEARGATMSAANEVLAALALVLAIGASRLGFLGSAPGNGSLLAFAIAFFLAYRPLRELAEARLATARAEGAYADLNGVIQHARTSAPPEPVSKRLGPKKWAAGVLEVHNLRLARGRGGPVSMRIEPGTIAVIMGPTAIGKTTLLRTLLGFETAKSGDVLFGGEPLSDAAAGPFARPFAWVPQDAPVLPDTLAANVSLGAPGCDPRDVLESLGAMDLADAGEARLGPSGRVLSGGERQWVALARAIATEQPVLLLDEPTSGLDPKAQRAVLDAIERLRGLRTVILVTHRSEPLAIADVVVRLVAEDGMERAA